MKHTDERRKHKRRPILESFHLSVVFAQSKLQRLPVIDLSEEGIGFDAEREAELKEVEHLSVGQNVQLHLYFNASLYLPLEVKIARVETLPQGVRRVGAEISSTTSEKKPLKLFTDLLDHLSEKGVLGPTVP